MLDPEIKQHIQQAYTALLQSRNLTARRSQRVMIAEIANNIAAIELDANGRRISEPSCCVVEAGTGTGKTLAYTLAAIPMAQALGKKVLISTATIALQEQIIYKDLPDIQKHSGLNFSFALAKGRRRYVCLARLDRYLHETQTSSFLDLYPDEQAEYLQHQEQHTLYASMLDALMSGSWDGDRECWPDTLDESSWLPLTADRNQCTGRHCHFVAQCSFFKARENLQQADCIVANHDLVLSDLSLGGGAILSAPAETIYIFDEAHHLSQKALQHFAYHVRLHTSMQWLEQLQQLPTVLDQFLGSLYQNSSERRSILVLTSEIAANLQEVTLLVAPFAKEASFDEYANCKSYRFINGLVPEQLKQQAVLLAGQNRNLLQLLQAMQDMLEKDGQAFDKASWDDCWNLLAQYVSRVEQQHALWSAYARTDSQLAWARWLIFLNHADNLDCVLHASPILAQDIFKQHLWQDSFAVILSSATLSALGDFRRLQEQLGLPQHSNFQSLQSPFDFQKVILNIPKMLCEPQNSVAHTAYIIEHLPQMLRKYPGNLVLFSSRWQMQAVYKALDTALCEQIITQDDLAKIAVVRHHCQRIDNGEPSTIFGLVSFAEGIDLPGAYCQHVIIVKIPFSVPGNPVEEALSEWLKQQGKNPFMEISVPDAAQALIQACGRLLRNERDEGEITLLDRRIVSKHYGQAILSALPPYTRNIEV